MMIDILYLSLLFISPGYIISKFINIDKKFLLIPSFSILFWSFGRTVVSLNYLIVNKYANWFVFIILTLFILKFKEIKSLLINVFILFLLEIVNNHFGILHIVSTTDFALQSAISDLTFESLNSNDPAPQITLLKFINTNYILLTLGQFISFTLFFFNANSIIKVYNLKPVIILSTIPSFLIFCVLLEIMTIRTHFLSSQVLCFLVIEVLKPNKLRFEKNIFFLMLCLFLTSRLENILLYLPIIYLILNYYFESQNLIYKNGIYLLLATTAPIFINFSGYVSGGDLRSNILIIFVLTLLLNLFIVFKNNPIVKFIFQNLNRIFSILVVLLGLSLFLIFDVKAKNSWLFILNHVLDSHRGWAIVTIYFVISIVYLIGKSDKKFNQSIFISYLLTFLLIIISSPLQHSVYGGEQWSSALIEGIPIYNPYDESQTRSILQIFLSIVPLTILLVSKKEKF